MESRRHTTITGRIIIDVPSFVESIESMGDRVCAETKFFTADLSEVERRVYDLLRPGERQLREEIMAERLRQMCDL